MTEKAEQEYIEELQARWPAENEDSDNLLEVVEKAVRVHPQSAKLWCIRGDLVQLASDASPLGLEEARNSYERALAISPMSAEAHESLACFCDAVEDNMEEAETHFREAIRLENRVDSYVGLARVLAQTARKQEALALLSKASGLFPKAAAVLELEEQIRTGIWSDSTSA